MPTRWAALNVKAVWSIGCGSVVIAILRHVPRSPIKAVERRILRSRCTLLDINNAAHYGTSRWSPSRSHSAGYPLGFSDYWLDAYVATLTPSTRRNGVRG